MYSSQLLDEARSPFGAGTLAAATRRAHAANPLCGDDVHVEVAEDGSAVTAVMHRTQGCTFTRASASLLARTVPGLSLEEARDLAATIRRDLPGSGPLPRALAALDAVRVYPARLRCALLPWEALRSAVDEKA
ncbi:MAG: iron-sulfur cluster assembly scaffold protein [Chloroflexi bacterium]|nr:iron-sulfur cluster assembly scaffold protein [Chloroflexota bacterium]